MQLKKRLTIAIASVALLACACALEVSVNTRHVVSPVEAHHALMTTPDGVQNQLNNDLRSAPVQSQNGVLEPTSQLWLI